MSPRRQFRRAVLTGLSRRRRRIPCRFLYDHRGAQLFDEICGLAEYYPTRTECRLLADHAGEVAALMSGRPRILEFGGCTPTKASYLFDALFPAAYLPIDICPESLAIARRLLAVERPDLEVVPICADFTRPLRLPAGRGPLLGFFPGSTIGNMSPQQALRFLGLARRMLAGDGGLLIGVDLKKSHDRLYAAYNDPRGVTAAFILNLLDRINSELEGDFDRDSFAHTALYNAGSGRVELHLVSRRRQIARVAGRPFQFRRGDAIHTEDSHKYTIEEFQTLARHAGFRPTAAWCDEERLFSLHFLRP